MRSLAIISTLFLCIQAPAQTFEPFQILDNPIVKDARFGYSVMSMGDLDGNGVPDILVGAPGENPWELAIANTITVGGLWLLLMDDPTSVGTISRYDFVGQRSSPDSLGLNIMELDHSGSSALNSVFATAKTGNSGGGNFGIGERVHVRQAYSIGMESGPSQTRGPC